MVILRIIGVNYSCQMSPAPLSQGLNITFILIFICRKVGVKSHHTLGIKTSDSAYFSKHRPSGPMLSISRNVCLFVCLSLCSLLRYRLNVFLPPLPEVGCPIFFEIRNPWGKVMERSGLRLEHFCFKFFKNCRAKKKFFFADFTLQNMVKTTLPDGLETSGRRAYR